MAITLRKNSRGGQAIVEYLLLCAILVGIIGGVLRIAAYNWFNQKVKTMQGPLRDRLNQKSFGIPSYWFFAGRDMNDVDANFKGADKDAKDRQDQLDKNNPKNSDSSSPASDNKLNPDATDNNKDGKEGGGDGADKNPNAAAKNGGKTPGTLPGKNNSNSNSNLGQTNVKKNPEDMTEDEKRAAARKKGISKLGGEDGYDAETGKATADLNGDGKIDEKDDKIGAERAEEDKDLTPEMKRKRRVLEEEQRRGSGSCRQLSTFELIRIAIFVLLAFVGFIVLFSSRGKGGD